MHPPLEPNGGTARFSIKIGKKFHEFHTVVSLNDGRPATDTGLTFVVLGDGRELWRSKPVHSQRDQQRCDIIVRDVDVLTLEVRCPGFPGGAHAVWFEPHLRD
jgi:hypothetical protein